MIKGQNPENIKRGNCFSEDGHTGARFDYMLSNPPFGVEWKKVEHAIRKEAESAGYAGLSFGTVGCTRGPSYPGRKHKPPVSSNHSFPRWVRSHQAHDTLSERASGRVELQSVRWN